MQNRLRKEYGTQDKKKSSNHNERPSCSQHHLRFYHMQTYLDICKYSFFSYVIPLRNMLQSEAISANSPAVSILQWCLLLGCFSYSSTSIWQRMVGLRNLLTHSTLHSSLFLYFFTWITCMWSLLPEQQPLLTRDSTHQVSSTCYSALLLY